MGGNRAALENAGGGMEPGFETRLCAVAAALESSLEVTGHSDAAAFLTSVLGEEITGPERVLAIRSALVSTRPTWEAAVDEPLAAEARSMLREAKRHAIDAS